MISAQQLDALDPQTRQVMLSLLEQIRAKDALIAQRGKRSIDHALALGCPLQQ